LFFLCPSFCLHCYTNSRINLSWNSLQLKIAKSVAEAKQFCTTDLDDFDDEEDDLEDFFE
jgi:hypothetical protein